MKHTASKNGTPEEDFCCTFLLCSHRNTEQECMSLDSYTHYIWLLSVYNPLNQYKEMGAA